MHLVIINFFILIIYSNMKNVKHQTVLRSGSVFGK